MAVVEEIHLRAYRAPTRTMGICEPAIWSVRVTRHGPRNHLRNVAYGNEPTRKEQACIATLDLVQAPIRCFIECMPGRELLRKPDGVLVISWTLLGTNGASTEHAEHSGPQQQHCAAEHPALPAWKYRAYVAAQQQSNRLLPATFFAELGYHELHTVSCDAAQRFARTPFRPGNHIRGAITLHGAGTLMPHAQPKFGVSSCVAIANDQEPAIRDRIVWLFRQRTDAYKI